MLIRQPPIFLMTIEAQASFVTEVQTILRQARDERDGAKLRKGNERMLSAEFMRLPLGAQADCRALYRDAFVACSGAMVP